LSIIKPLLNIIFPCTSAEDAQLTPVLRLGAGACAGIIAMSATYPMDMVRGRITVQVLSFLLFTYSLFYLLLVRKVAGNA